MKELIRRGLPSDPFHLFSRWFNDARRLSRQTHPDAMCLSTAGLDGFPDGRVVLLKGVDERGFIFYTNSRSLKGRQMKVTPKVGLTFHWDRLSRQVRIQGPVERINDIEADEYFASRPRGSQIGAWVSQQSAFLTSRALLDKRWVGLLRKYKGKPIPRPAHWHGYRVVPRQIEFWQEGPHRLHDRFLYIRKAANRWIIRQLYP